MSESVDMGWLVTGIDANTGDDTSFLSHAADRSDAIVEAVHLGVVVADAVKFINDGSAESDNAMVELRDEFYRLEERSAATEAAFISQPETPLRTAVRLHPITEAATVFLVVVFSLILNSIGVCLGLVGPTTIAVCTFGHFVFGWPFWKALGFTVMLEIGLWVAALILFGTIFVVGAGWYSAKDRISRKRISESRL